MVAVDGFLCFGLWRTRGVGGCEEGAGVVYAVNPTSYDRSGLHRLVLTNVSITEFGFSRNRCRAFRR